MRSWCRPAERSSQRPSPRGAGGRTARSWCRPAERSSQRPSPRGAGGRAASSRGSGMRCAHRFGRSGGEFLVRARFSTTTRLSGAHRGRARGGQAAGRYVLGAAQLSGAHRGRAHGGQAAGRHVWALVGLAGVSTCRSARPARRGSPGLGRVSTARSSPAALGHSTLAPRAGSVRVRASQLVSCLSSHGHGGENANGLILGAVHD